MTHGERNCNPGNIRHVHGVTWQGQAPEQTDPAFVQFVDAKWGIRAIVRILNSYEREGIHTICEAIDRWAPPNENNSKAYVNDVCARCNREPAESLSLGSIMHELVAAIIGHENGRVNYTGDQITEGIDLACLARGP